MRLEENKKIKSTIPKELQNSNEEKKLICNDPQNP
jgi:hypothetical protein